MVDRLCRVFAPGEGAMTMADNSRYIDRIDSPQAESLDDGNSGVPLIVLIDLLLGEMPRAGDLSIEIIRMGGTITGNVPPRL